MEGGEDLVMLDLVLVLELVEHGGFGWRWGRGKTYPVIMLYCLWDNGIDEQGELLLRGCHAGLCSGGGSLGVWIAFCSSRKWTESLLLESLRAAE